MFGEAPVPPGMLFGFDAGDAEAVAGATPSRRKIKWKKKEEQMEITDTVIAVFADHRAAKPP